MNRGQAITGLTPERAAKAARGGKPRVFADRIVRQDQNHHRKPFPSMPAMTAGRVLYAANATGGAFASVQKVIAT